MPEAIISAEIEFAPSRAHEAALALQRLGFRILHIGPTISVQGPQSLWESTFRVSFETRTKKQMAEIQGGEVRYQWPRAETVSIPESLQDLIVGVMFVEPPEFF